jgi:hypothetical protein
LTCSIAALCQQPRANSDPNYLALRSAVIKEAFFAENIVLQRDAGKITLRSGTVAFLTPVLDRVAGAVFVGDGRFQLDPVMPLDRRQLKIVTDKAILEPGGGICFFAKKPEPEIEPGFEEEVRAFLAQHGRPDAASVRRMVPGVRGDAVVDGAASVVQMAVPDMTSAGSPAVRGSP